MNIAIVTLIISLISIAFSAIALIMNRLSTFRRYRINHNIVHYFNVPGVNKEEGFIGVDILNIGYHPVTINEVGVFDVRGNRYCVPWIGVPGAELPITLAAGNTITLPLSINELEEHKLSRNTIKHVYARDSLGRFKKQKFKADRFMNEF
jgi:hypothetical protein